MLWIIAKKLLSFESDQIEKDRREIQHLSTALSSELKTHDASINKLIRQPVYKDLDISYTKLNGLTDWVHIVHPSTNLCSVTFRVGVGNNDEDKSMTKYLIPNI